MSNEKPGGSELTHFSRKPKYTKRLVNETMEDQMFVLHEVLDHGFVRLIDYMGGDETVCRAARVSYGAGTKSRSQDRALIRYMVRNAHTSPLEQCGIRLHLKLPLFVAQQLLRHRTAKLNQMSARYSVMPEEFYVPDLSRMQSQSVVNAQGSGGVLPSEDAERVQKEMTARSEESFGHYRWCNSLDLAKELSRINLPASTYTEMYWKIDLHNLLHFLSLRMDSHAQYEIRVYADVIGGLVKDWVPMCWEAFEDYHPRRGGHTFSRQEMLLVRKLIDANTTEDPCREKMKEDADKFDIGSSRERKAFWTAIGLLGDCDA